MFLTLVDFKINNFRKIEDYSIHLKKGWTSISGINSSGKSSIILALTSLHRGRNPESSDIRTNEPFDIEEPDMSIQYSTCMSFKLHVSFLDFLDNPKFKENYIAILQNFLDNISENHIKKGKNLEELEQDYSYKKTLQEISYLKTEKQISEFLMDGYTKAISEEKRRRPVRNGFKLLFKNKNILFSFEELVSQITSIEVICFIPVYEEPIFRFQYYNEAGKLLLNHQMFFSILHQSKSFDILDFAQAFGVTYLKGITNESVFENNDPSLEPSCYLNALGTNISNVIHYYAINHHEKLETVKQNFELMFSTKIDFDLLPSSIGNQTIFQIGSNDSTEFNKLADGMKRALRILIQLEGSIGSILLIDEIEQHLHPGACKILRRLIFEKKNKIQVITTTHSPIFIDPLYIDNLILNRIENEQPIPSQIDSKQIHEALSLLGSSGVDSLFYEIIIWVEGESDKIYLEKIITELLLNNSTNFGLLPKIGIQPCGGKENLKKMAPNNIKNINRKSIFILDSDRKRKHHSIAQKDKRFKTECENSGLYCWITKRREIENYIPTSIFENHFGLTKGSLKISLTDDVITKIEEITNRNFDEEKIKLANEIVDKITYMELIKDKNAIDEINENVISKIIELIGNPNYF